MKRGVLIICVFLLAFVPLLVMAQEEYPDTNPYGLWKRNFAAPTYGMAVFGARVKFDLPDAANAFHEYDFRVPAVDVRIFKGTNVSRRGGFYTGVEVGALIFIPSFDETFHDDVIIFDPDSSGPPVGEYHDSYDFTVEVNGGSVFIMMKYGLRLDLGVSLFGLSAGFEFGAGAALQAGGYRIMTDIAEEDYGSEEVSMNLIVEPTVELALRLGRNFRLIAKAGVIVLPPIFRMEEPIDSYIINDGFENTLEEYRRYALQGYKIDLNTVGYDARVGFALNFN